MGVHYVLVDTIDNNSVCPFSETEEGSPDFRRQKTQKLKTDPSAVLQASFSPVMNMQSQTQ